MPGMPGAAAAGACWLDLADRAPAMGGESRLRRSDPGRADRVVAGDPALRSWAGFHILDLCWESHPE